MCVCFCAHALGESLRFHSPHNIQQYFFNILSCLALPCCAFASVQVHSFAAFPALRDACVIVDDVRAIWRQDEQSLVYAIAPFLGPSLAQPPPHLTLSAAALAALPVRLGAL